MTLYISQYKKRVNSWITLSYCSQLGNPSLPVWYRWPILGQLFNQCLSHWNPGAIYCNLSALCGVRQDSARKINFRALCSGDPWLNWCFGNFRVYYRLKKITFQKYKLPVFLKYFTCIGLCWVFVAVQAFLWLEQVGATL